jgi:hypothetical protein
VLHAIGEHGVAEWTASGYDIRSCSQRLLAPFVVHLAITGLGLLEHLRATSSTTKTILFTALQFHQGGIEFQQYLAWCLVFIVATAQVARVVKGDPFALEAAAFHLDASFLDQCMMNCVWCNTS